MPLYKVCPAASVGSEKVAKYCVGDQDILLAKSSDGKIWAFDSMCSHADKSLEKGSWNPELGQITCPYHKAIFAVCEHGAVKAPPAFAPIATYDVVLKEVEGINFVFIHMED